MLLITTGQLILLKTGSWSVCPGVSTVDDWIVQMSLSEGTDMLRWLTERQTFHSVVHILPMNHCVAEKCVNAGCQRTSQSQIPLYISHSCTCHIVQMESRFFSAFLHRMKQGLILQQAKSKSIHDVMTPIIFPCNIIQSNIISKEEHACCLLGL